MSIKLFLATFAAVFLAELGDKTQLATMTLTAENSNSRWIIFGGAASALVLTTLLGVIFGDVISRLVPPKIIKIGAAILFIGIGVFMLVSKEKPVEERYGLLIQELRKVEAASKAGCVQCERFQTVLRKLENAKDAPLQQAISFLRIDIAQAKPPKDCDDCTAKRIDGLYHKLSSGDKCKKQSPPTT